MRDLYHNVLVTQHLNPITSSTTKTSTTVDLQGFSSADVVFAIGASGDTLSGALFWTLKLQHSDDDSTYVDTALTDLNNTALTVVVNSSSLDKTAYGFGYQGNKRYLKGVATPTGTHTNGTPIGILALRGAAAYRPVV
jgi:hypothetical protein